jgi:U3 small nucleolar RNA-associated protein 14
MTLVVKPTRPLKRSSTVKRSLNSDKPESFSKIKMANELDAIIGLNGHTSAATNTKGDALTMQHSSNDASKRAKKTREDINLKEGLTQGVDLSKLKMRYQKDEVQFKDSDIKLFEEENGDQIFDHGIITNALDINENKRLFEEEKEDEIKADLPQVEKTAKGWGTWTGFGVKEPLVDKEKEKRELQAKIVH